MHKTCILYYIFPPQLQCEATAPLIPYLVAIGGHTGEMLQLIKGMDMKKYSPMYFLLAHSDVTSRGKIEKANKCYATDVEWLSIHRSREVKQSFVTSVFSTLIALKDAVLLISTYRPELILCNGPGRPLALLNDTLCNLFN